MKFSKSAGILTFLASVPAYSAQPSAVPAKVPAKAPTATSAPSPTSAKGAVSWTRFSDPFERAFTIEVPAGWTVRGGLYRKGVLDPRIMVDVTSPDGQINYRIGDASIPPYTIPTPMGMQLGFREGAPYGGNGRVQGMIARYRNGTQYANLYAQARFGKACGNIAVKSMRPADPLMRIGLTGDNAGEVVFTCEAGGPRAGYVYAQSSLSGSVHDGLWGIPIIYSFLAPQAQGKMAMELMTHSVSSYRENPQWTQAQLGMIQQTNRQIQRDAQANLDLVRRQAQRADSQLKLAQDFDDIINGVTLTRDPTTGQTREGLTSQNPYHWVNGLGGVVSTPTDNSPGANYQRLQTINRGQQ